MTKTTKHILVVSQYFYPEQFRINDICSEWVKRGYKVTVLTGIPNYPQGEFYDGYNLKENRKEEWNGIQIVRIPLIARGHNAIGLIANYLSFVFSGYFWKCTTKIKADFVFTYEVSPMTQALIGVWYSKKYQIPNYLYVTDLWPENVEIITGIHSKVIIAPIQAMVDYIYRNCTRIFTSSNSFIKSIEKRNIDRANIEFWPQYAEDFYKPVNVVENEIPQDDIFNIVFAGNIGYAQGLGILVEVAQILRKENLQVRFNIIGEGRYKNEFVDRIKEGLVSEYFNLISRKSAEQIPNYLASADALLITLAKSEVFSITIPAKTQSCMACGKPILVSADGEVQDIVLSAEAGLASGSEDAQALAENVKKMLKMSEGELNEYGKNALKYSQKHFNKEKLLDRMDSIFAGG